MVLSESSALLPAPAGASVKSTWPTWLKVLLALCILALIGCLAWLKWSYWPTPQGASAELQLSEAPQQLAGLAPAIPGSFSPGTCGAIFPKPVDCQMLAQIPDKNVNDQSCEGSVDECGATCCTAPAPTATLRPPGWTCRLDSKAGNQAAMWPYLYSFDPPWIRTFITAAWMQTHSVSDVLEVGGFCMPLCTADAGLKYRTIDPAVASLPEVCKNAVIEKRNVCDDAVDLSAGDGRLGFVCVGCALENGELDDATCKTKLSDVLHKRSTVVIEGPDYAPSMKTREWVSMELMADGNPSELQLEVELRVTKPTHIKGYHGFGRESNPFPYKRNMQLFATGEASSCEAGTSLAVPLFLGGFLRSRGGAVQRVVQAGADECVRVDDVSGFAVQRIDAGSPCPEPQEGTVLIVLGEAHGCVEEMTKTADLVIDFRRNPGSGAAAIFLKVEMSETQHRRSGAVKVERHVSISAKAQ